MTRARHAFAAVLVAASFPAITALAQTTQAPPMTSVLAGKKFSPPIKGQADVEFAPPEHKRDKAMVITTIVVKNISNAPIPRLTVDETYYDSKQQMVTGGKGFINGLLQPGEIKTIEIQTPYDPKMSVNQYQFSHANGTVKTHAVKKGTLVDPNAKPAAKPAAAAAPKKKK